VGRGTRRLQGVFTETPAGPRSGAHRDDAARWRKSARAVACAGLTAPTGIAVSSTSTRCRPSARRELGDDLLRGEHRRAAAQGQPRCLHLTRCERRPTSFLSRVSSPADPSSRRPRRRRHGDGRDRPAPPSGVCDARDPDALVRIVPTRRRSSSRPRDPCGPAGAGSHLACSARDSPFPESGLPSQPITQFTRGGCATQPGTNPRTSATSMPAVREWTMTAWPSRLF
jgi:hypothetical protein